MEFLRGSYTFAAITALQRIAPHAPIALQGPAGNKTAVLRAVIGDPVCSLAFTKTDTFGRRLRAARVRFETRQVLLAHKNGSITTHYSAAEIRELIEGVSRIHASRSTPVLTTLRAPSVKVVAKSNAAKKLGHAKVA